MSDQGTTATSGQSGASASASLAEPNESLPTAAKSGLEAGERGTHCAQGAVGDTLTSNDVDFLAVGVHAGDRITIRLDALSTGSNLFGVLRLFDSSGKQLAQSFASTFFNEDPKVIDLIAPETGQYVIGVSGLYNLLYDPLQPGTGSGWSTGDYFLSVATSGLPSASVDGDDPTLASIASTRSTTTDWFDPADDDGHDFGSGLPPLESAFLSCDVFAARTDDMPLSSASSFSSGRSFGGDVAAIADPPESLASTSDSSMLALFASRTAIATSSERETSVTSPAALDLVSEPSLLPETLSFDEGTGDDDVLTFASEPPPAGPEWPTESGSVIEADTVPDVMSASPADIEAVVTAELPPTSDLLLF